MFPIDARFLFELYYSSLQTLYRYFLSIKKEPSLIIGTPLSHIPYELFTKNKLFP